MNTTDRKLKTISDETYVFALTYEQDGFYAGVIALADYLRDGAVGDDRLKQILEHVRHAEQVRNDPRDPRTS